MGHLTEGAVRRELQRAPADRMEQVVEALHHRDPGRGGGVGHPLCLGPVPCERLLGQHRLAGGDRGQVPRSVQCVRQRVVDDVDFGVGHHVLVGRQDPFDTVLVGKNPGAVWIPRGHCHQAVPQLPCGFDDGALGDPGRTQDPDPQRLAHTATVPNTSRR